MANKFEFTMYTACFVCVYVVHMAKTSRGLTIYEHKRTYYYSAKLFPRTMHNAENPI